MKYAVVGVLVALCVSTAVGQRHHETVIVGANTGVRIRPGNVVVTSLPQALARERILASIHQQETGQPEFYVTNTSILAQDGTVITDELQGSGVPALDVHVVVVPRPMTERRYYVFATVRRWTGQVYTSTLRFAEVDMLADSVGGVVTDGPRTIESDIGMGLTTIRHCDGRRYWLITHHRSRREFRAQQVTAAGLSEVVTTTASEQGWPAESGTDLWLDSFLASNAQGTYVAQLAQPGGFVDVFSFDNQTGKFGTLRSVARQPGPRPMAGTFSPDGTKFYWNVWRTIYSLNLSRDVGSWAPELVDSVQTFGDFETGLFTGPDGRIYVGSNQSLVVITRPNNARPNEGFGGDGIDLTSGGNAAARSFTSMPMPQHHLLFPDQGRVCAAPLPRIQFDSVACLGSTVEFIDRTQLKPTSWRWSFQGGSPSQHSGPVPPPVRYAFPGIYRIRLVVENEFGETELERFIRIENPPVLVIDSVPAICRPGTVRLAASGANRYQWFPTTQVTDPTAAVTEARVQRSSWIYVRGWSVNQCEVLDSVFVRVDSVDLTYLRDTAICAGGVAQFAAIEATEVQWQPINGVSDPTSVRPEFRPRETTTYSVTARRGPCEFTRQFTIEVIPDGQERVVVNDVCVGDTIDFTSLPGALWTGLPVGSIVEDNRVRVPVGRSFSARMTYDRGATCRLRRDHDVTARLPTVGRLTIDDAPFEVGKERQIRIGSVPPLQDGEVLVRLTLPAALMEPVVTLGSQVSSTVVDSDRHVVIRVQGGGTDLAVVRGQVLLAPIDRLNIRLEVDSSSNCVRLSNTELLDAVYTGCGVRLRPVTIGVATAAAVRVWPQPVGRGETLQIDAGGEARIEYRLVDAVGRVHAVGIGGAVRIQQQLSAGLYALQIALGEQATIVPVLVE